MWVFLNRKVQTVKYHALAQIISKQTQNVTQTNLFTKTLINQLLPSLTPENNAVTTVSSWCLGFTWWQQRGQRLVEPCSARGAGHGVTDGHKGGGHEGAHTE